MSPNKAIYDHVNYIVAWEMEEALLLAEKRCFQSKTHGTDVSHQDLSFDVIFGLHTRIVFRLTADLNV